MRLFANIIWHFPFFGFVSATLVYLLGLLLTLTVIAAPIGLGLMELGKLLFAPFGKTMIKAGDLNIQQNKAWKAYSTIIMVLYLPFGILLAIMAILQIGMLFLTIIGIPVAIVVAKSLTTYLNPVGKKCVSSAVATELERKKAEQFVAGLPPTQTGNTAHTVFCPECGKGNLAHARFCSGCGTSLPDRSQAAASSEAEVATTSATQNIAAIGTSLQALLLFVTGTVLRVSGAVLGAIGALLSSISGNGTGAEKLKRFVSAIIALSVFMLLIAAIWPKPVLKQAQPDTPATVEKTVKKISPEKSSSSQPAQSAPEPSAQPEPTVLSEPPVKEEEITSEAPQQIAPAPAASVEEPVQKPATPKTVPKKAASTARKSATTQPHANPQQVTAPPPIQASKPAPVQPAGQSQTTQPVAAHPKIEQPQKHQGLRGLIHEVTGIDPGTASAVTEHQCTASEKSMHVNGC